MPVFENPRDPLTQVLMDFLQRYAHPVAHLQGGGRFPTAQQYLAAAIRKVLEGQAPLRLYHGTSAERAQQILEQGFRTMTPGVEVSQGIKSAGLTAKQFASLPREVQEWITHDPWAKQRDVRTNVFFSPRAQQAQTYATMGGERANSAALKASTAKVFLESEGRPPRGLKEIEVAERRAAVTKKAGKLSPYVEAEIKLTSKPAVLELGRKAAPPLNIEQQAKLLTALEKVQKDPFATTARRARAVLKGSFEELAFPAEQLAKPVPAVSELPVWKRPLIEAIGKIAQKAGKAAGTAGKITGAAGKVLPAALNVPDIAAGLGFWLQKAGLVSPLPADPAEEYRLQQQMTPGAPLQLSEGGKVLDPLFQRAAEPHGLDPELVKAIAQTESSLRPRARRAETKVGDVSRGLMQLRYQTAKLLGFKGKPEQLFDPATNLALGARYLGQQVGRYQGDLLAAIAAYNAGTARRRPDGSFANQKYVNKVLQNWKKNLEAKLPRKSLGGAVGSGTSTGAGFIRG